MFKTDFSREDGRVILQFRETRKGFPGLFRNKVEARDLWQWSVHSGASGALAYAELSRLIEADPKQVIETEKRLILDDKALAQLSDNTLKALGLPRNPGFTFCLEQRGSLASNDLKVVPRWIHGGREIRVKRDGVLLAYRGERYVIPDPVFNILSVIDKYKADAATDIPGRMAMVARILELVPRPEAAADPVDDASYQHLPDPTKDDAEPMEVRLEGALSRFKVKTAGALSFDVALRNDGYHITPVLFARVPDEGKSPASEKQGLLTKEERLVFEHDPRQSFFSSASAKRTYLLQSGEYVLIDENLFPAIAHVRELENTEPEVRERFAKNPSRAIAEIYRERLQAGGAGALTDDIQQEQEVEQILSSIIVETKEFSDRVTGLGLWVPPVIPWVKKQPNSWAPEEFGIYLGNEYITLPPQEVDALKAKLEKAIRDGEKTVRHNGRDIPATEEVRAVIDRLIGMVRPDPESGDSRKDRSEGQKGETDPSPHEVLLIKDNFDEHRYDRELQERPDYVQSSCPPADVSAILMAHQKSSFEWQITAYVSGLPGVLNADDQGLGKTLQTIAFMAWQQDNMRRAPAAAEKKPMLVVAPTTLLRTWESEVEKHMHGMFGLGSRIDAYGMHLERLRRQAGDGSTYLDLGLDGRNEDDRICWVLTTYETLAQNQVEFAKIDFATVVFDEIQNVKNVTTLRHRAAQSLKSDFVIGLTGTPVENDISELWAIMDTIAPGRLGSLRGFMDRFRNADENEYRRLHEKLFDNSDSPGAAGRIPAIGIRRMKSETVADLPRKNYRLYPTDMPEIQARAYDTVFLKLKSDAQGRALEMLHQLRSVSLYPDNLERLRDKQDALETMMRQSARIRTAIEIIDDIWVRREKVLLFTETHDMQHLLRVLLRKRYGLEDIAILNGKTTLKSRGIIVENFEKTRGDGRFDMRILSPRVAGVGITMTAATHIIHLSRWWNPAVEEQCNDRIYRIGQDQDCTIHIPLAVHPKHKEMTFDCILNDIMERKRKLFRDVLMPCEDSETDQSAMIAGMTNNSFDLKEIDLLDWEEFEKWSARKAQETGVWKSSRTPRVGDGGLDVHLEHRERGDTVLVQCKYSDDHDKLMSAAPVAEVLHAATRYDVSKGHRCVVLTNAGGFDHNAQKLADEHGVILVDRHRLCLWPTHIV